MAQPSTPEKQLLNLIEKPMSRGSLNAAAIKYHGLSWLSMGGLRGRFAFLKNKFKIFDLKSLRQLDIRLLNKILKFSLAALVTCFIVNLSLSTTNLKKELNFEIKVEKLAEAGGAAKTSSILKSASYYLDRAKEKDIFRKGMKKIMTAAGVTKTPSQRIMEATANYRLVGISWSENPDVMIEDTKTQRTFFLKRGQVIENDIMLKDVFKDRVILGFAGEEVELR